MKIASRDIKTILLSIFQRRHYVAAINMLRVYVNPFDAYWRYVFGKGNYPAIIALRTPMGLVELEIYSYHDMLTVNEIFCRKDYDAQPLDNVVVDFGSNIGISAAYFLTRSPKVFAYLVEPVDTNILRLKKNLSRFEGRFKLYEVAVGLRNGPVIFGVEGTGRYAAINLPTGKYVKIQCRDANEILQECLDRHGEIDLLKVDIEGMEKDVIRHIPESMRIKIKKLFVEFDFGGNPMETTHTYSQSGVMAAFIRK